jgi:hypothetical protein
MQQFKKGEPFVIFPEGNVFYDGHTHPFKKGIARIAFAAHQNNIEVPIVPVGITYESGVAHYNIGSRLFQSKTMLLICKSIRWLLLSGSPPRFIVRFATCVQSLAAWPIEDSLIKAMLIILYLWARPLIQLAMLTLLQMGKADFMVTESLNVPTTCPASSKAATCT